MKRKLQSKAGETLVETLFATLLAALAMLMLAGAIVTAAKVNKSTKDLDTAFHTDGGVNNEGTVTTKEINGSVVINREGSAEDEEIAVTYSVTEDDNAYWYYK